MACQMASETDCCSVNCHWRDSWSGECYLPTEAGAEPSRPYTKEKAEEFLRLLASGGDEEAIIVLQNL